MGIFKKPVITIVKAESGDLSVRVTKISGGSDRGLLVNAILTIEEARKQSLWSA